MTPRYLTLTVSPEAQLLERTALRDNLLALLQSSESRWIVVHGDSGIGKSTLANACFHEADKRDLFQQYGWVDFTTNLSKSIVKAISNWEPREDLPQNEAFYEQAAREEVSQLRNYDCPQLIILDGVPGEAAILDYLDLIEIRKARVLITTRQPFSDPRFLNFRIPPLEDGDVLHFFNKSGLQTGWLGADELHTLRGNAWLMRLLVAQTPHFAEKSAKDFLRRVFDHAQTRTDGVDKTLAVAQGIFEANPPDAAACWTLLQFAALPPGRYDLETMISYLGQPLPKASDEAADDAPSEFPDDLDLADLAGCRRFAREWRGGKAEPSGLLSEGVAQLAQAGWLSEQEGEYSIHDNAVRLLKNRGLNQSAWFPELCNCLSVNYFTEQHPRLKINLLYECHLLSFLDFAAPDASDGYLGVLSKLIKLYEDIVDYRLELACRLKYLGLIEGVKGDAAVIDCKGELSENYRRLGRSGEAKVIAEEALSEAYSKENSLICYCQNQLGLACDDLGEYERARDLLETALASDLKNFGADHPNIAVYQSNLAKVYDSLGQYDRARDLQESALTSDLKNFGADHPNIAVSQSNLANVYDSLGQYERARDLLETALASDLKNFGADHPNVAVRQSNLANVYNSLGQYDRARDLLESALASAEKNFGPDHPNVAVRQSNLANVYNSLGQYDRARDLLETALSSDLKNFGADHPTVAVRQSNLASMYASLGQYERARDLLETALSSDLKNFGADHPTVAVSQSNLANVYRNLGQYDRARDLLESALASDLKNFGADHPNVAVRQLNLGVVFLNTGEKEKARELFSKAYRLFQQQLGEQHPETQNAKGWLDGVG